MTSRHIDIGKRGHGAVKILFHADIDAEGKPLPAVAPITAHVQRLILAERNRQACEAIDHDWSHMKGFSSNMRHARRA